MFSDTLESYPGMLKRRTKKKKNATAPKEPTHKNKMQKEGGDREEDFGDGSIGRASDFTFQELSSSPVRSTRKTY